MKQKKMIFNEHCLFIGGELHGKTGYIKKGCTFVSFNVFHGELGYDIKKVERPTSTFKKQEYLIKKYRLSGNIFNIGVFNASEEQLSDVERLIFEKKLEPSIRKI
jgi:hypothetical protein